MNIKPSCHFCEKEDSAFCLLAGKMCCSSCLLKFEKKKSEEIKRIINVE